ncbi:MAG: hypothetical protein RL145_280, partial [Pseudomonadota bacterium]
MAQPIRDRVPQSSMGSPRFAFAPAVMTLWVKNPF